MPFDVNLSKFSSYLYINPKSWFYHWTNLLLSLWQSKINKHILWKWHHLVASLLTFWWHWCLWSCFVSPTLWHRIQGLHQLVSWRLELDFLCLFLRWSCVLLFWLLLWHSCWSEFENNGFKFLLTIISWFLLLKMVLYWVLGLYFLLTYWCMLMYMYLLNSL